MLLCDLTVFCFVAQVYEREALPGPRLGCAAGGGGSASDRPLPSQVALDWTEHGSRLVDVADLPGMERRFIDGFEAVGKPLDRTAQVAILVLTVRVLCCQEKFIGATSLTKLCIILGQDILTSQTKNASACLMKEVGRVARILEEFGALRVFVCVFLLVCGSQPMCRDS